MKKRIRGPERDTPMKPRRIVLAARNVAIQGMGGHVDPGPTTRGRPISRRRPAYTMLRQGCVGASESFPLHTSHLQRRARPGERQHESEPGANPGAQFPGQMEPSPKQDENQKHTYTHPVVELIVELHLDARGDPWIELQWLLRTDHRNDPVKVLHRP